MKILFVTENYWPYSDGGSLFVRRLTHQLIADGDEVEVVAPSLGWRSAIERDGQSVIYREKTLPYPFTPGLRLTYFPYLSFRRALKKSNPDIVHIHGAGHLGLATIFWTKRRKIPLVITNHLMPDNLLMNFAFPGWIKTRLKKGTWEYLTWFSDQADFVISPTETAVNLLKEHGLKKRSQAVTNGVDATKFNPALKRSQRLADKYHFSPDRPTVLYFGRVDAEKRVDEIIRAFALVPKDLNAQLVIAGKGNRLKSCQDLAKKLRLSRRVIFTGYIDEEDKPRFYRHADVFTITSPAELQSIVMLEAMASGLPVVAVDEAALPELCQEGKNGYSFKLGDARQFAGKLELLLRDKQKRQAFGQASRAIVEKYHTMEISLHLHQAIYQQLMQEDSK